RQRCLSIVLQTARRDRMKRFHFASCLALTLFGGLVLAGPALAQHQVPFKGRLAGVDTGTPLVLPIISLQGKTTGYATILGKCTFGEQLTVSSATGQGSGTFLFTAADGSTVYGTGTGQATFTPPNVLNIAESLTITGGTGRFAGATGSFTVSRVKNTVTGAT